MNDSRRRAEEIFQEALDRPASERQAFARTRCAGDETLLEQVLVLLRHDPGTEQDGIAAAPLRLGPSGKRLSDPDRIGPYRILERIGEGGFGVVYEVEQSEPLRRRLALKVLKAGMDTEDVLARFDAERQALALMDHPFIARVHDAGATEQGRPYFAMELVRGDPVNVYCDREGLDLGERLRLFESICRAVQHAHQRGVIHRDLKPSNILITRVDGEATPKVIDFGIAKALSTPLVNRTLHTVAGQVMGTPTYMSPEQGERSGVDVDTSTDVYSLGVVLYELLSGCLPVAPEEFDAATPNTYAEILRRAQRRMPSQCFQDVDAQAIDRARRRGGDPWQIRGNLRGDLDSIVMRSIARDRSRRYATVQELLDELARYHRDEPVLAGPPGLRYRVGKFARRHRVSLGIAGAVTFGVIAGGAGLTWSWLQARQERAEAVHARHESEAMTEFLLRMLASSRPTMEGKDVTVLELLDASSDDLAGRFDDQPEVEVRLRNVIGGTYRELGNFEASHEQLERGFELARQALGPAHPRTLEIQREIGVLERHAGAYADAESTLTQVLRARRQHLAPDDRAVVQSLDDLGALYLVAEDATTALPILEEGLRRAERSLPPNDALLSRLANNLGLVHQNLSHHEEAEEFLLRSLELDRVHRGAPPGDVFQTLQNLASVYRLTERYDEAEAIFRESEGIALEVFGEDHPATMRLRGNFALLLSDMGRYDESLEYSLDVLAWRERELGPDNPSTIVTRINLALLYLRQEDFESAWASARETASRCRRVVDENHLYSVVIDGISGRALVGLGRMRDAERMLADVAQRSETSMGPEHWRVGSAKTAWGGCLAKMGRYEEAEPLLLDAHGILAGTMGPEHARTREAASELAGLYRALGQEERADTWLARAETTP